MAATVNIIPFAVSAASLDRATLAAAEGPVRVAPFRALRNGVISTLLPDSRPSIAAKALRTLEDRIMATESEIAIDG
jgi:molybdenum cofactor cytidylyltransferase